jgi:hypothetical protein
VTGATGMRPQCPAARVTGVAGAPPSWPAVPPRQTEPAERRLLGKPMHWSRGWALILVVWVLVGAALLAARLDMGHLTVWSASEAAAVAQVRTYKPDGAHSTDELLGLLANELTVTLGASPGGPRWYAFERSWEDRVYVVWEWSSRASLTFTVRDGEVSPDGEARLVLRTVARSLPGR